MSALPDQNRALSICDDLQAGRKITEEEDMVLRVVLYECYQRGFFKRGVAEEKLREITWVWHRIRWVRAKTNPTKTFP